MLGFIARWKGVVAALASSEKPLLRCSILLKERNLDETEDNH
jgi:hypothetical protein